LAASALSNNWSFLDAIKTDKTRLGLDFTATSVEEKVQLSIKTHGIVIPKAPEKAVQIEQVQPDGKEEKEGQKSEKELVKEAFYDKADLISFHELFLSKQLVKACSDLGFEHPTVIQRKSIPSILEGSDVLTHAVTGSGKTATFLLPLLEKHLKL